MILGIMQPYFFPYLGYFQLIEKVDSFILLDAVQFIRHGWIERNRIINPNGGWQYIKVPLSRHSRSTLIRDIRIRTEETWQKKIYAQLVCYKNKAPYFKDVIALIEPILNQQHYSITHLNRDLMVQISRYYGINTKIEVYSELGIEIRDIEKPGDWALKISGAVGADVYINPIDGKALFDRSEFDENNISLKFIKNELPVYNQKQGSFEEGLSILDIMMFCNEEEIAHMFGLGTIVT